ncbi:FAD-dependent monooxygenase [Actinoplanes sp. RD1]|uniref:FAD-dependent monooxygenase n=1 Tax=Actinoplanes sp. RD1 TaxID=3064538 RepID=UPI00274272B8|nr:FAD-dependent monooxygenase [Actinoplanes sp. RD1]
MNRANDNPEKIGVLVVGAGPTGLTLGLDLARRGVPCQVIEAGTERPVNPRCNTTSARSMEIFRRLGVADDVRRAGLPGHYPTSVQYRTTMRGTELFRLPFPSSDDVLSGIGRADWPTPEPQHRISQIFLEPILEEHARRTPGLTLERGCRLVELREHPGHVEAVVESGGQTRSLLCDYVVGCDGAHSVVRRGLGVRYEGVEAIRNFVSTFVRSPELGRLAARDRAWTYWTFADGLQSSLIAIDGGDRWLHHVAFSPDHDTSTEDPEKLLTAAVGGPIDHEVLGTVRWTGRQLVATTYQRGRVFLAGDAAHIWIPVGGFGMNTGIQDAVTLGWMLAAVHQGWAPAELLQAYERERKPVGDQFAGAVGRAAQASLAEVPDEIHAEGADGDRARRELAQRLARTEPHRYSPDGFSFGYHYAHSPLVLGGADQPAIEMGAYESRARPGFRLPHVWLPDGSSVLDVLGAGFTLLRTGDVDAEKWRAAAAGLGVPLTVFDLPAQWPDRFPSDLILVRPDQHVAWMGTTDARPDDVLATVTGRRLASPAS